ncbi:MAG TPA: hypothetical protein VM510_15620 [Caulifigura sp.]|nr:hypothetical protein [Caulifigura sp.]
MKRHQISLQKWLVVVSVLSCWGCGGDGIERPARVPVQGVVTLNSGTLASATVIFQPTGHPHAAMGTTDGEGRFQLTTFELNDGAVPGEFKVCVVKHEAIPVVEGQRDDTPTPSPKLLVPAQYSDPLTSGLTATVVEGNANELKFELTGKPGGVKPVGAPRL